MGQPTAGYIPNLEQFLFAGLANFNINERFRAGVMGYYLLTDKEEDLGGGKTSDTDLLTMGAYVGFNFTPSIELKGIYYMQDQGDDWYTPRAGFAEEDSASAWKAIIDVNQDLLKFTSAWLEYGQMDNNFMTDLKPETSFGDLGGQRANVFKNAPRGLNTNSTKLYGVYLGQQWNDKWSTFARYYVADFDTNLLADTSNWTLGVAYQLNPAVQFLLAYDNIDFGNSDPLAVAAGATNGSDHMIRFRTFVTF
jgi:hypothetical protein